MLLEIIRIRESIRVHLFFQEEDKGKEDGLHRNNSSHVFRIFA
jgi:hypothetical protein